MIFTTFYFSGTGNTKWAVNELHQAALAKGHQSRCFSIEDKLDELDKLLHDTDFIGIAFPVYVENVPEIMKQFLHRVGQHLQAQKSLLVLTTVGFKDGCGPYEVLRQLPAKNVRLQGYTSIKLANNLSSPASDNKPVSQEEVQRRLEKGRQKISGLIQRVGAGKRSIDLGVYLFMRPFRKRLNKFVEGYDKVLSIDAEACRKCMLCANNCPTRSIRERDGKLVIMPTCTACMRCFNSCPAHAVWHGGKYADPEKYPRYRGPKS